MGGSLVGSATVSIGHTARIAWSHTVATGTTMNLHQLTLAPDDPTVYVVHGKREAMTKRTVTVQVKGGQPVTRTQWWTRYGPVVTGLGAQLPLPWTATTAYALNDPNATNLRAGDTALGFSKARDVTGIQESLRRTQGLPWVNTIASDSSGGLAVHAVEVLPRIPPTSWRSAARHRSARSRTPRRVWRSWTVRGRTARWAATRTRSSPASSARRRCRP
ncbi:hypothetical protein SSPIM334S_06420 [Streptomyces spiroverticillatus]